MKGFCLLLSLLLVVCFSSPTQDGESQKNYKHQDIKEEANKLQKYLDELKEKQRATSRRIKIAGEGKKNLLC